ncbi:hypothetical protein MASR2M66_29560 [Chloroflexota bacterium]
MYLPSNGIVFAGKITDSQKNNWLNNRLVIVYLQGQEVARDISSTGDFPVTGEGVVDGLFVIEIPNTYKFRIWQAFDNSTPLDFARFYGLSKWFGEIPEGGETSLSIPNKNITYKIKVFSGDVSSLPSEILLPNSTQLLEDGQVIVALPDSVKVNGDQANSNFVQSIHYATKIEQIQVNKLTVPINNCAGSVEVSQKYTQTQTFVHQYTGEVGFNIGVEIPFTAWAKLTPEFTAKYGFENGQVDTRAVEYNMAAAPGTNVMYIVTWSEVWESGAANVLNGNDTIVVPFRVKTNLIYDIASEPRTCP